MSKTVVLVGHCGPDSSYLRMTIGAAERGVQIVAADDDETLKAALEKGPDLLLFNRVLDYGFSENEGVAVMRKLRGHYPKTKMMLVSNFPEAQAEARAAGALPGFGKRDMGSPAGEGVAEKCSHLRASVGGTNRVGQARFEVGRAEMSNRGCRGLLRVAISALVYESNAIRRSLL